MLTVAEAASFVGRHPETIRRWIRTGRLLATRAGRSYLIDADDLRVASGPQPDWVEIIRTSREERGAHLLAVLRATREYPTPHPGVCE
jgi:excisionase family DNA binding protein